MIIPVLAGCASRGNGDAAKSDSTPAGHLQVFSATKTMPDGDSTFDYPHTGYTIYDQHGRFVQYVPNHAGRMDEVPTRVSVPAGKYRIKATSERYGAVTIPVEIMAGQFHVIHLENTGGKSKPPSEKLIRSADGKVVGWSE
jgi:hypothetical protein